jgi:hypothetical protein
MFFSRTSIAASVAGDVIDVGLAAAGQAFGLALASLAISTEEGDWTLGFDGSAGEQAAQAKPKTTTRVDRITNIFSSPNRSSERYHFKIDGRRAHANQVPKWFDAKTAEVL